MAPKAPPWPVYPALAFDILPLPRSRHESDKTPTHGVARACCAGLDHGL